MLNAASHGATLGTLGADDDERSKWPTRSDVARILGCSVSTVRRREEDGTLPSQIVDSVHRFNPEMVELHRQKEKDANGAALDVADMAFADDDERDDDRSNGITLDVDTSAAAARISSMERVLRHLLNSHDRGQAMQNDLVFKPSLQLMKVYRDELDNRNRRIAELEKWMDDSREAMEVLRSMAHERKLATERSQAMVSMRREAFTLLKDHVPHFFQAIIHRIDPAAAPLASKAIYDLLAVIPRTMVEEFKTFPNIDQKKLSLILDLKDRIDDDEQRKREREERRNTGGSDDGEAG